MTGSVEGAKEATKDLAAEVAKDAGAKPAAEATAKQDTPPAAKAAAPTTVPPKRRMPSLRIDSRLAAVATVALVVGTAFGLVSAPKGHSGEAFARIEAGLEAGRTEAARLNTEIEQLTRTLTAIRDSSEAARGETRSLGTGIGERLTRLEQGLDSKIAALGEKAVQTEREQGAALTATPAQAEKRAATPATVPTVAPAPVAVAAAKPEPMQTASIADTKPKSETIESWALRDVYDGVAMLEDRKRRLVEVAPGDSVPGVGRVESIERRGRTWVVVTRQGLITPQMW